MQCQLPLNYSDPVTRRLKSKGATIGYKSNQFLQVQLPNGWSAETSSQNSVVKDSSGTIVLTMTRSILSNDQTWNCRWSRLSNKS